MKTTEYRCDICDDAIGTRPDTVPRPFVGYDYNHAGRDGKSANHFYARPPHETDRHFCHACLAGLVALARRTLPAEAFAEAAGVRAPEGPAQQPPFVVEGVTGSTIVPTHIRH